MHSLCPVGLLILKESKKKKVNTCFVLKQQQKSTCHGSHGFL